MVEKLHLCRAVDQEALSPKTFSRRLNGLEKDKPTEEFFVMSEFLESSNRIEKYCIYRPKLREQSICINLSEG